MDNHLSPLFSWQNSRLAFGEKICLENFSLTLPAYPLTYILGRSGAGKSVLLKTALGFLSLSAGTFSFRGNSLVASQAHAIATHFFEKVRASCGFVFQFPALIDQLNTAENLQLALSNPLQESAHVPQHGFPLHPHIQALLSQWEIPNTLLHRFPHELSFGLQKKISFLRLLLKNPDICLFDEPTTSVDPPTARQITQWIHQLALQEKKKVIVISHDLQFALAGANHILFLDHGNILFQGPPEALKKSTHPLIQSFLQEARYR